MYSAVGTAERADILQAAYDVAGNLTAVQEALAAEGGVTCEEGAEEGEGEACEGTEPPQGLQAVRIQSGLYIRNSCLAWLHLSACVVRVFACCVPACSMTAEAHQQRCLCEW